MAEASLNSKPAIQTSSSDKLAKELAQAVLDDETREGGLLSRGTLVLANRLKLALAQVRGGAG